MNKNQTREARHKGFTLLEILLVIAAIGILAAIVIVAINPVRQLGQSRDVRRESDLVNIQKALELYKVDNDLYPLQNEIPVGRYVDICPEGVSIDCIDLDNLVPNYIASIPVDPLGGRYEVGINEQNNRVSIRSPYAEIQEVAINAIPPYYTYVQAINRVDWSWSPDTFYDGSVAVGGYFGGETTLGEGGDAVTITGNPAFRNSFISKYNPDGTIKWAKSIEGSLDNESRSPKFLSDGSLVSAGWYEGQAIFGSGEVNETILTSSGDKDYYLVKYDSEGSLTWVNYASSSGRAVGWDSVISSNDSIYVTGHINGETVFSNPGGTDITLLNGVVGGGDRGFLARYDDNGQLQWVRLIGDTVSTGNYSYGVTLDQNARISVVGSFLGTIVFGEGELNETQLVSSGSRDVFIAQYSLNGDFIWAEKAGGLGYESGWKIDAMSDGSVIVVGEYNDTITFGEGELNETILTSAGNKDMFIAKYDSNGLFLWAKGVGGVNNGDVANDIAVLRSDDFLVTGWFEGSVVFGAGELNETELISNSSGDAFVAKYTSEGELVWVRQTGSDDWDGGTGLAVFSNGGFVQTVWGYPTGLQINGQNFTPPPSFEWGLLVIKFNSEGQLE